MFQSLLRRYDRASIQPCRCCMLFNLSIAFLRKLLYLKFQNWSSSSYTCSGVNFFKAITRIWWAWAKFKFNSVQFLAWDQESRNFVGEYPVGNSIIAHEFAYNRTNQMVYDRQGVKVFSNIAVHYSPGPVSYRLEWNGLKFTFSGRPQTPFSFQSYKSHYKPCSRL